MRTMAAALAIVVTACSGAGSADAPTSTVPPSTSASTTTLPATTIAAATTTSPTTTTLPPPTLPPTTPPPPSTEPPSPPPTEAPALPVPLAAPAEDGSTDPKAEIGTIEIPRIGLTRSMFEGIRLSTLNNGPGHWPGTAMPGEIGNVVIAGHRVSHNKDFRNLDQLAPGDEVIMSTMTGRHVYHVVGTEVVQPDALWIVDQTGARTATLFACHPPGSTSRRIVVHLELTLRTADASTRWTLGLGSCCRSAPASSSRCPCRRGGSGRSPSSAWCCSRSRWGRTRPGRPVAAGHGVRGWLAGHGHGLDVAAHGARLHRRRADLRHAARAGLVGCADRTLAGPGRPAAFSLVEALRFSFPFGGVPLASLGISQVSGPLAGIARVGGVILITWVVFQSGFALGAMRPRGGECVEPDWVAFGGLSAVVVVLAVSFVAPRGTDTGRTLDVVAVQGGGAQGTSALDVPSSVVTERHLEATRTIDPDPAIDVVVWPENVVDTNDFAVSEQLAAIRVEAARLGVPIAVGVTEDVPGRPGKITNAQVVISPDGTIDEPVRQGASRAVRRVRAAARDPRIARRAGRPGPDGRRRRHRTGGDHAPRRHADGRRHLVGGVLRRARPRRA